MPDDSRNESERLWTAEDVADFLGCHVQTVYRKAREGELPSVKVGGLRRFNPAAVRAATSETVGEGAA